MRPAGALGYLLRSGTGAPSRTGPRGFTLVEVLTVAVVVGTLARMAVPGFHDVLLDARAAEVAGDFEVVRVAAMSYHADHHGWPADGYTGQVPAGLAAYLPEGFGFQRAGYRLDWENWSLPSGTPADPGLRGLVGISVVTDDRSLGAAVRDLLGGNAGYALGDTYTFILDRR